MAATEITRCPWAAAGDALYLQYHDHEWGVPQHDDRMLFELLTLEGAQAGLSWSTILRKREGYRRAFAGFDPQRVARLNQRSVDRLMGDAGIVRNRLKIESTISNARAFLQLQKERGSFDAFLWDFVGDAPIQNRFRAMGQVPASTSLSDRLSKELRRRGFRFVGSTICYAYMQAIGIVNDHTLDCFRHRQVAALR